MSSIFVTQDATRIAMPWREDLAALIPHAKEFAWQGERMLVIPNRHEEAKVARNVGVPVPAPILTRYDWAGSKPWDIQRVTAALLTESPRCYVLSTMGTGKTRSVLFALDYLFASGAIKRALIAAPLSTLTPVWETEIFQLMLRYNTRVLYGDRDKRLKLLNDRDLQIAIINHHGLHTINEDLVARAFDVFVIDELAVFRNKQTQLWKAATTVVECPTVQYAWGLTGSPTPNAPTDAWAQMRMLTPARTTRTRTQFQDLTMRRVSQFRYVPRADAVQTVHTQMQPSVRYTRDDVMELPETLYVDRAVKLDAEADKAYRQMVNRMKILTDQGNPITSMNEAILQNKLLQIACGFIYTDAGQVFVLPSTGRLRALDEVITETDRKVIVLVPYIHALQGVAEHLRKMGHSTGMVYGETSRSARDIIFRNFQTKPSPRVLIAHPQTLAHGLTLTAANTIVWYAPTNSLEHYEQANARITRPGQSSKTLIVHLSGTQVERLTYARLKNKARMQGLLLDMFHQQELIF